MKYDILAIIITYHPDSKVLNNLYVLERQIKNILVVDNGSPDNEILEIESTFKVIKNNKNLGIAKALNIGIQYALENNFDWVITFDQDSTVSDNMIETMLNAYNNLDETYKQKVMSLVPIAIERKFVKETIISDVKNIETQELLVEITSGNLVKTEAFRKIGFFDEKLFIDYVDHDFCLRLNIAGFLLLQCKGAKLIHEMGDFKWKIILGKKRLYRDYSPIRVYYQTRNRFYICRKYKKHYPAFVKNDRKTFIKENFKMILWGSKRIDTIKMIFKGLIDSKKICK